MKGAVKRENIIHSQNQLDHSSGIYLVYQVIKNPTNRHTAKVTETKGLRTGIAWRTGTLDGSKDKEKKASRDFKGSKEDKAARERLERIQAPICYTT